MEVKAIVTKTVGTVGAAVGAGTLGLKEILSVDVLASFGETGVAFVGLVSLIGAGALALDYFDYIVNEL